MRAVAARTCRIPSKPIGFSTFSTSHVNKTYENIRLSHPKSFKNLPARSCRIFEKPLVFDHSCQSGLHGQLLARTSNQLNIFRAPARGAIPVK